MDEYGTVVPFTKLVSSCIIYADWVFRITNVLTILLQLKLVHSERSDYCVRQLEVLVVEARWMYVIIFVTLLKVIVFGIWAKLRVIEFDENLSTSPGTFTERDSDDYSRKLSE